MKDIVILSLFRHDSPYSSTSLSLALELAKSRRVFYINHPYSIKDLFGKARRNLFTEQVSRLFLGKNRYEQGANSGLCIVHPPCTLPINWLPKGFTYRVLQGLNNWILARCIKRLKRDKGIKSFIYLNCYNPFFLGVLPKSLGASHSIYQCVDDISQDAYTRRHGVYLENEAIGKADLTLTTSSNLKKLKAPFSSRIDVLYNAADTQIFSKAYSEKFPKPSELEGYRGKVIGFFGNFDAIRIDYDLLKAIALRFPQYRLLLIGPMSCNKPAEIGLDVLSNVQFIGPRPLSILPSYLQYMDVALIPFACNTLTASIYPLKINEYLAAGKPVVSTAFSEDIRQFSDFIYLAENQEQFLHLTEQALAEKAPDMAVKRRQVAETNSWEARARQFLEMVGA